MRKSLSLLAVLALSSTLAFAQVRTVTGRVTDANGKAVPYATVSVKGTNTAVSADENGTFTIQAAPNTVLVFSAAGLQTSEVNIGTQTTLNAALTANGPLSEVVVTALGIRRADRTLGYSVGKVDPNSLTQKSEPDLLKSMQGKVAGVDIRSSQGTPGSATRIQIRGNNSFDGNNQPLIVVDGVPYSNNQVTTSSQTSGGTAYGSGIANLDPNDIASMTILKGSSASALYGSRASNGVVVITTKSGSASRSKKGMEVTLKNSVSWETVANLPTYQNEYGAGANFSYSNSNGSWGPSFSSMDSIPAWPDYKAAYPELFPSANIKYQAYPNNVKDLFKTGLVVENSIGFNSGSEKASMALTASRLSHNGYVDNADYKRYNVGVGGAAHLDNGLRINGNFSYARSTQRGGYFGENQVDGAASMFARTLFLARNWDLNLPYQDKAGKPLTPNGGGQFDNPRWAALHNVATTQEERLVATVHLNYEFNKWFSADYTIGNNVNTLGRKEITDIYSRAAQGLGRLISDNYRFQEIESNFLLNFTPRINDDFTVRAIVGNNFNQRTTTRLGITGNQFVTPGLYTLENTSQKLFDIDRFYRRRLIGLFGDVTLGFKNYAFIELTGRNDWTSTLAADQRSYFYPSISGTFIFTDAFNISKRVLDFGKVRAGYSKVGRDTDPYATNETFIVGNNFLGQPTGSVNGRLPDAILRPEFTYEAEVGTNLSFFNRLAEIDFAYYNRRSESLLAPVTTSPSTGYASLFTNFGTISNKGIEVDLTIRPLRGKDFTWEVRAAFTKNKNIVESLTEGVDRIPLAGVLDAISPYAEPGLPYGYLRGTVSVRDSLGNLLINPTTGGMIEATEQAIVGNPNPDWKLGVTNTLNYKGIILSALWDMTKGGDMYSVTTYSLLGRGVTEDTRDRETSWVIPGVYGDPNTGKPILVGGKLVPNQTRITTNDLYFSPNPTAGATFGINTPTEWNVYDATVYRLREVTLGYQVPKKLYQNLPIGSVALTLTGRNLWYSAPNFPRYTNFDPEVNSFGASNVQGIELSAAPTTRRYGVNLSITF